MFRTISRLLKRFNGQRGQMLVVGVMFMGVIAGSAAIAVDTGSYLSHRRSLQNAADAIAGDASQGLPATGEQPRNTAGTSNDRSRGLAGGIAAGVAAAALALGGTAWYARKRRAR